MKRSTTILILSAILLTTSYTTVQDRAVAATATAQTSVKGQIVSGVNLRDKPSTSGKIIGMVKKGTTVTILETSNSYFYKVKTADGQVGYISSSNKYIEVGGGSAAPEQQTSATVIYGVNLRTAPSTTSGSVITMLKKGTVITILEKSNDSFYKVKASNGQVGYVSTSSKYLELDGDAPSSNEGQSSSNQAKINQVLSVGQKYLGTPYEFGSDRNSTKTFDCSAFVRNAYKEALGIVLPADSRKQGAWIKDNGTAVSSISSLKAGDLIFFMSYKGSSASAYANVDKSKETITHVAMYMGNGKMIHTYSKASGGVRIDQLDGSWKNRFLFGGSVLK
ncbi:MAG TPA: SH3 domain-containing C40 family peptidase [Paenibacillus sp.]